MFTFANKAGLDMLETSLVALQDLTLDKIFDESGRKAIFSDISKLMEQVRNQNTTILDTESETPTQQLTFVLVVLGLRVPAVGRVHVRNGPPCFFRPSCSVEGARRG